MPKLIQKSGYFKPHEHHSVNYMKYIATREGVEKVVQRNTDHPATEKQLQLIANILRDYPDAKELFEYEDYIAKPCLGSASEFITMALDSNWDSASSSKIYMRYIATRPHVEKRGGHGLFSDRDNVDLDEAIERLSSYDGKVWTFIFSLRREDAASLSYDNAAAWQSLLKAHRAELTEALKISSGELCWYAAFHNESHHPHIHMMVYSKNPQEGYLNTEGIRKLRSALTNTIFKQELLNLYEQKADSRDELVRSAREAMAVLIREMQSGICENAEIASRVSALAEQLKAEHGKMQYGYLKPRLKTMVDGIVDELERIPAVAECYGKWREVQCSVQNYYTGEAPERLPLSRQKEFKTVKNAVIREALNAADNVMTFEDEGIGSEPELDESARAQYQEAKQCLADADADSEKLPQAIRLLERAAERGNPFAQYQLGKLYLTGEDISESTEKAVSCLTASAEQNNPYAQYALGKLYLLGKHIPRDKETALRWLELSAAQGNVYAQYFIDHADDHTEPSALLSATRLLYHLGKVFRDNSMPPGKPNGVRIDSKRRRKLRDMKIAAGHAEDEQDSEYTQIMSY